MSYYRLARPWNYPVKVHTYEAYEDEYRQKMVEAGTDIQDAINSLDQSKFSKLENFEDLAGRNASWTYLEREKAAFE